MNDFLSFLQAAGSVLTVSAEIILVLLVAYLLFLTLAAIFIWLTRPSERLPHNFTAGMSRGDGAIITSTAPPLNTRAKTRFAILVPAHNEELLITRAVQSLLGMDYPRDMFSVNVIADNCTDNTAELAREAGAIVHERSDTERRGKGYALRWLFLQLLNGRDSGDVFVVIDADSVVNRDFLGAFDRRIQGGAVALQSYGIVLNANASWGTALRYIAFALLHYLRPTGRKLFGGSAGLKGNGMGFRRELLAQMDWGAFSVTEDLQFHLDLLLKGHVVEMVPDAVVWSDMPDSLKVAHAQNVRWESGRLELLQKYVPSMLLEGIKRRNIALLDAAMDNIVPPFSFGFALVILLLVAALLLGNPLAIWLGVFNLAGLVFYTLAGLVLARAPGRVYLALLYAPIYIVWKLAMWIPLAIGRRNRATEWTRTERGNPAGAK